MAKGMTLKTIIRKVIICNRLPKTPIRKADPDPTSQGVTKVDFYTDAGDRWSG